MGQIAIAEPLAEPGETVLSPEAWEHVKGIATGTSVGELVHACTDKVLLPDFVVYIYPCVLVTFNVGVIFVVFL